MNKTRKMVMTLQIFFTHTYLPLPLELDISLSITPLSYLTTSLSWIDTYIKLNRVISALMYTFSFLFLLAYIRQYYALKYNTIFALWRLNAWRTSLNLSKQVPLYTFFCSEIYPYISANYHCYKTSKICLHLVPILLLA